ncbi:type IV toxin-antitoxin system AbiEi family antitoxin domain-containing protein [Nocardioides sp. JQ2195]|uniref:type IV toxin-antitoxin system AbiEi family antitoxin domain-containing protein n=1 Tax=Nocardioides sp. JQ2195 TaxID=2592334 RepID=UPI00143E6879|nr:type IV toxin-antitoxin system AbiEi family antitoxin domain-containing protein [Nocardioides sp. JQ2195]QIX27883.1 type IV toxin-antitoxin system AbiEi family antitoxin domain-containing protein [Nocardioides sp. JQ2195]
MGETGMGRIIALQDGVVARRQVLEAGLDPHDIERMLRRREWARVLPGVYVDHTGAPTWLQLAWAGVLHYWPAALAGSSAIRLVQGPGWRGVGRPTLDLRGPRPETEIEILVAAGRTVQAAQGYRVTRCRGFEERVQWNVSPPRLRFEEAVLDLAAGAPDDTSAIGVLADACQSRRTTAARLLSGLDNRRRMRRRAWLVNVLRDVAEGTCSALEHAHLANVERPHHLPRGERQARETSGSRLMFRDVKYPEQGVLVELDGRLFHDSVRQRDADLERDLDAALDLRTTVRLGWGQCTDRACDTASRLGRLLQLHGWLGRPTPCGPRCSIGSA